MKNRLLSFLIFALLFAPTVARADSVDLSRWNVTIPVDSKGTTSGEAIELPAAGHVAVSPAGDLIFTAPVTGATTSGSKYPRDELRELNGTALAGWKLATGGTMTATVSVDQMPLLKDGTVGKAVIGQIHGASNELTRLYWNNGVVNFHDDISGTDHKEHEFTFPSLPVIPLGKKFSYEIDAAPAALKITIFLDGKTYATSLVPDTKWTSDTLYFKAGIYLGENASQGATGQGQDTFYALDYGHTAGAGLGGLPPPPVVPPAPPAVTAGKPLADQLRALADQVEKLN